MFHVGKTSMLGRGALTSTYTRSGPIRSRVIELGHLRRTVVAYGRWSATPRIYLDKSVLAPIIGAEQVRTAKSSSLSVLCPLKSAPIRGAHGRKALTPPSPNRSLLRRSPGPQPPNCSISIRTAPEDPLVLNSATPRSTLSRRKRNERTAAVGGRQRSRRGVAESNFLDSNQIKSTSRAGFLSEIGRTQVKTLRLALERDFFRREHRRARGTAEDDLNGAETALLSSISAFGRLVSSSDQLKALYLRNLSPESKLGSMSEQLPLSKRKRCSRRDQRPNTERASRPRSLLGLPPSTALDCCASLSCRGQAPIRNRGTLP